MQGSAASFACFFCNDLHLVLLLVFLAAQLCAGLVLPVGRAAPPALWQFFAKAAATLERRLNRSRRADETRFVRGFLSALFLAVIGVWAGAMAAGLSGLEYGFLAVFVFLSLTATASTPLKILYHVRRLLETGEKARAARFLQPLTGMSLESSDAHALARRAIECGVLWLNRFLVGPVFFYLVGGLPAAGVYAAFSAWDKSAGLDDKRYLFSWLAMKTSAVLDFIPARLTAAVLALAAVFVAGGRPVRAVRLGMEQAKRYRFYNEGWPLAAAAGALNITLAGRARYSGGNIVDHGWIGDKSSSARLGTQDIRRALILLFVAVLIVMAIVAGLYLFRAHGWKMA